ncbi:lactonase family protein [Actinoplanes sp. NPDC051633]|uniref:lactonase family protein n=1 Tax=Actinoplanes sp. NPDC051633 TaxID=3155670 RepID=UPI00341AED9D
MSGSADFVYVGSYTGESGGEGEGIALLRRDRDTGDLTRLGLAARTPSPSFLARHPTLPVLYAVNELLLGAVSAFAVAPDGSLEPIATGQTGGGHPCHLALTRDGRHLLAANYSSGSVSVLPLGPDGRPGERTDLIDLDGQGPDPERQKAPHAHMVLPDDTGHVLIADLGSDRVWRARLDPLSGRLTGLTAAIVAEPGTGPRHLRPAPDGAVLLVGELSGELSWYRPGNGGLERRGARQITSTTGVNYPSELAVGRDGRFVYVANRGPDTIAIFGWDGDTASRVGEVPTGGTWPRHIALIGDHLYVANERSHSVTVLRIDPETGLPTPQGEPVQEPSPTCFLRWERA